MLLHMPSYKKLPGRGRAMSGQTSLWLGEDHLLLVTNSGYREDYRRFYFQDIQAIVVRKTVGGMVTNYIAGGCAALFLLLTFSFPLPVAVLPVTAVAVCVAALLINTLLGPTCECFIQTMTARHQIPPFCRTRRVAKAVADVRPFIIAAQGELPPDKLSEILGLAPTAETPVAPVS